MDSNWILKHDASLKFGGEINSPILTDNISSWIQLDEICLIVDRYAKISTMAGGHIHFGTQILGDDINNWLNFLKLWSAYENIIFRFCYGNFLDARKSINFYAKPVALLFKDKFYDIKTDNINDIPKCFSSRYQAVNFKKIEDTKFKENNTIEFRCPNASLQSVVWQNNINFLAKLILYCQSNNYDEEKILYYFKKVTELTCNLSYYREIFLEQSLELCDMIFDNNLDKLYFLKQYIKSFEIGKYAYAGKVKIKKL